MQTWFTDSNIYQSLLNLDRQRLFSMIYENTHGLGALLNCVDDLILSDKAKAQAKKLINKPQCKLWVGYERHLFIYITRAYIYWYHKFANKEKTKFNETINYKNLEIISQYIVDKIEYVKPNWITDELIQTHRSVLIQKNPNHYKKLWNDCPTNLKMHYSWRKN
jgi:ribosomal protein S18